LWTVLGFAGPMLQHHRGRRPAVLTGQWPMRPARPWPFRPWLGPASSLGSTALAQPPQHCRQWGGKPSIPGGGGSREESILPQRGLESSPGSAGGGRAVGGGGLDGEAALRQAVGARPAQESDGECQAWRGQKVEWRGGDSSSMSPSIGEKRVTLRAPHGEKMEMREVTWSL
jgi:hypothetical protein